ncbi:hypothetical protein B0O99DRAFT_637435 [Bisporella sp. PMI_857]|nr:hypothetical protein B0O99DRAFT_637435 [Bisporella sp. PMI_857]
MKFITSAFILLLTAEVLSLPTGDVRINDLFEARVDFHRKPSQNFWLEIVSGSTAHFIVRSMHALSFSAMATAGAAPERRSYGGSENKI